MFRSGVGTNFSSVEKQDVAFNKIEFKTELSGFFSKVVAGVQDFLDGIWRLFCDLDAVRRRAK